MASLSGWTEAAIGIGLVVAAIGVIIFSMNVEYGQSYDPTFNISTDATQQLLQDYQGTLETGIDGEAQSSAQGGINVVTSWSIIKAGLSMVWSFVTGGFVDNTIGLLPLGNLHTPVSLAFRLLFIFSIGFILIKILFKIKP